MRCGQASCSCATAGSHGTWYPARARLRSRWRTPVKRGDSLPEQGRRRAFPRLPLVDDGFMRRAHQRGQLRLAQSARAANCANLLVVVTWHAGPGQWRATIIWADRPPIVRPPKRGVVARIVTGPHDAHRQDPVRLEFLILSLNPGYPPGNGRSAWSSRCLASAPARARIFGGAARRPASHVRYDSGGAPSVAANAACDWPSAIRHSRSVRGSTTSYHAIGAGRREARGWRWRTSVSQSLGLTGHSVRQGPCSIPGRRPVDYHCCRKGRYRDQLRVQARHDIAVTPPFVPSAPQGTVGRR